MKINELLRSLREDRDLGQKEIAEITGVSVKQVWRWEQGTSEMGIEKLKKICEFYKVSADYILGLEKGLSWPREEKRLSHTNSTKSIFLFSCRALQSYALCA